MTAINLGRGSPTRLGATPQGKLEQWDENAVSLLEFSVDEKCYFALHQDGRRALFDASFNLLISTAKFSEWSSPDISRM